MTAYTATTQSASESITVTPEDPAAAVEITLNNTPISGGVHLAWTAGANTVRVRVTNGQEARIYTVTVTYTPPPPPESRLSALTIGSLTLAPAFDPDVHSYTAATTNNTNTITATPMDSAATMTITVEDTPVANGTAASWQEGENKAEITVSNDAESATYTVTVTKS